MEQAEMVLTPALVRDIARGAAQDAARSAIEEALKDIERMVALSFQRKWDEIAYPRINSTDIHLRNIELAFGNIQMNIAEINSRLGGFDARIKVAEGQLDELARLIHHPVTGLAATRNDMALMAARVNEIHNTIHGDPEERSGNPSLFELIQQQNRDREVKHAEQMAAVSGLVRRVEDVETWIRRRQAVEASILNVGKRIASTGWAALHDWRFWLAALGTGAAIAAALLAGQNAQNVPDMFDWLR